MGIKVKILLFVVGVMLSGCRQLPNPFDKEVVLAKVGERSLKKSEALDAMPKGLQGEDSTQFMDSYVERWLLKQVKVKQAEELFLSSTDDVERMVEEYRQSLLMRKLDNYFVDKNIDTLFTDAQIEEYYNAHKATFKLDRAIVKGRVVRFDAEYRQWAKLKSLMGSKKQTEQEDFIEICRKNGFELTLFDVEWIDFSEFLNSLPTLRSKSYDYVLDKKGDVQQMRDTHYIYYFQIYEVREVGELIPLERLRSTIRRILFNQRQSEIIDEQQELLIKSAVESGVAKRYI